MVALALSVLALSGGLAAGEPTTPAPVSAGADCQTSCTQSAPVPDVTVLDGVQLRGGETSPIRGLSLTISDAPMRESASFDSPLGIADVSEPIELQLSAPTKYFDVGVAQRMLSTEYRGAFVTGQGAEVRIGQGLSLLQSLKSKSERTGWYLFAASDGRQLSWAPTSDPSTPSRTLRLDNAVEIGDLQVGLAAQHGPLQTSLSLVKRTIKSYAGPFKTSADGSFAGLTLSYKR